MEEVNQCFAKCVAKYGGNYKSGDAYMCSKGCAGMSSNKVTDRDKFCGTWGPETYGKCVKKCKDASSNSNNQKKCKEGCKFWKGT